MNINFNCTSIFCDDVRYELNGKVSLMGIYNDQMFVPDFPITLPKVCAHFDLRVNPDFDCSEATLIIMKGAEKISSITLALSLADDYAQPDHGKQIAYKHFIGGVELPNIRFEEPTLMEILAQIDKQVVVGGRLWVTTFPVNSESESAALK